MQTFFFVAVSGATPGEGDIQVKSPFFGVRGGASALIFPGLGVLCNAARSHLCTYVVRAPVASFKCEPRVAYGYGGTFHFQVRVGADGGFPSAVDAVVRNYACAPTGQHVEENV